MPPLMTLIWKEWRETRIYLAIGLFVFLGLPLIGTLEARLQFSKRYELQTLPFVYSCGGILAVLIAVGTTCRDLVPRLADFWQSRPVSPAVWMIVKYLVGLAVLAVSCDLPLLGQYASTRDFEVISALITITGLYGAAYTLAFLAGVLIRRNAHAAMFGLAALLLLWFLPFVLPGLHWLSLPDSANFKQIDWPQVRFVLSMFAVAAAALGAALLALRFDWQIESGRKTMYGALAGAVLILFGSLTLRLGTNLPELQRIALDYREAVSDIVWRDDAKWLQTQRLVNDQYRPFIRPLRLTDAGLEVDPPIPINNDWFAYASRNELASANVRYRTDNPNQTAESDKSLDSTLQVITRDSDQPRVVAQLWQEPNDRSRPETFEYGQRLFVVDSHHTAIFDLSDPLNPKELSRSDQGFSNPKGFGGTEPVETLVLPQLPDVPPTGRLEFVLQRHWYIARDEKVVCFQGRSGGLLYAYELVELTGSVARYRRIAERRPMLIENVFGTARFGYGVMRNGLLYVGSQGRYDTNNRFINNSVSVFDVRAGLKLIGHFAAPGVGLVEPLPDGRAISAGNSVYLIGPPPRR